MSDNRKLNKIIQGIGIVLAVDTVIWVVLFFSAFLWIKVPFIANTIDRCLRPDLLGARIGLARGLNMISLMTGSVMIIQFLYVIPVTIWLWRKQRFELMKGVIIGAALIALLVGSCFTGVIYCR